MVRYAQKSLFSFCRKCGATTKRRARIAQSRNSKREQICCSPISIPRPLTVRIHRCRIRFAVQSAQLPEARDLDR